MISNGSTKLQQKTYSVPNLAQQLNENNTTKIITVNNNEKKIYQHQTSDNSDSLSTSSSTSLSIKKHQLTKKSNASSDTLVQDDNNFEPEIDYQDDDNDDNNNNKPTLIQPLPPSMLSTFSSSTNLTNIKSSPLTPRQLKQRNSAKRSISRSSSTCNINDTINETEQTSTPPPPPPPPFMQSITITPQQQNNRSSSQPPVTPTRTSSTLVYVTTTKKPEEPIKNQEPIIKSNGFNNNTTTSSSAKQLIEMNNNKWQQSQQPPLQFAVRNELEKAIENRIKRTNNIPETVNKTSTFAKPNNIYDSNAGVNKRNLPREPPPPPPVTVPPALRIRDTIEFPPPPPPLPSSSSSTIPVTTMLHVDHNNLPPPPSPTQLNRLNKIVNVVSPVIKLASPIQNQSVIDPRTSSDFGALIAKKAAEKRAKFHEAKPSVNAVTFQADGSKVFTNSENLLTISSNNESQQIPNQSNYLKQNGITVKKTVNSVKPLVNNNNSAAELGMFVFL
jgi:hypothetical protein